MAQRRPHNPLLAIGRTTAAILAGAALAAGTSALASEPAAAPKSSAAAEPQTGRAGSVRPRSAPRAGAAAGRTRDDGARPQRRADGDTRTRLGADAGLLDDNPFGAPPERERRRWFQTADADGTGWISFREAKEAIGFDGPRFRVFDVDHDGRFSFEEYTEFLHKEIAGGRQPNPPRRPDLEERQPPRSAEQLRMAYDVDLDGHVSRIEMDRILLDYRDNRQGITAATMIDRFDLSGDSRLGLEELRPLANYLMPLSVDTGVGSNAKPNARTPVELFGAQIDRGDSAPPLIEGPVPLFRRLDLNSNGAIEISDLQRLEPRAFSPGTLGSILRTLDSDYDGSVSEGEFLRAMRSSNRRSLGR